MKHHRKKFRITKSSGYPEPFSQKKLRLSLERSGLPKERARTIVGQVTDQVTEGTPTKDIFQKTLQLVNKASPLAAAQYSLKKALFDLGPTGHPFETYVARYFEALGFQTEICRVVPGKLVKHEIDVIATKGDRRIFVECKFHNRAGIKNDIKIALYVKARRDDLREGPEGKGMQDFYLVSNTSFSLDALTYAEGSGLTLLGVNAPPGDSFFEQIKRLRLYPITSLRRLGKLQREALLARDLVLARDLLTHKNLLFRLGVSEADWETITAEITLLDKGHP